MPWIEVHGMDENTLAEFARKIFGAVEVKYPDMLPNVLVEEFLSRCHDFKGKAWPHLRICSSDQTNIDKLVEVLRPLGVPVSVLVLGDYYPAIKNKE